MVPHAPLPAGPGSGGTDLELLVDTARTTRAAPP